MDYSKHNRQATLSRIAREADALQQQLAKGKAVERLALQMVCSLISRLAKGA